MAISDKPSFYDFLLSEVEFIPSESYRMFIKAYLSAVHLAWSNKLEIMDLDSKLEINKCP